MKNDHPSGPKVLLVEDHPAVRKGIRILLEQEGFVVTGLASGGEDALRLAGETAPQVVVVDLSLDREDGLDLIPRLRSLPTPPAVLIYTMHEEAHRVRAAFRAGALGYVTKRADTDHLVTGIREVREGRRYLGPLAARVLVEEGLEGEVTDPASVLSPREWAVYHLLGEGYGAAETGSRLGLSRKTVESYCQRIMVKLGVDGMKELRRHAIAHRLLRKP